MTYLKPSVLADIPLYVPALLGAVSSFLLFTTTFVSELDDESASFTRPARLQQIQINRRMDELTRIALRSSRALYSVKDLPARRYETATIPLRYDFPFIYDVFRVAELPHAQSTLTVNLRAEDPLKKPVPYLRAGSGLVASGMADLTVEDDPTLVVDPAAARGATIFRVNLAQMVKWFADGSSNSTEQHYPVELYRAAGPVPGQLLYRSGAAPSSAACHNWPPGCRVHRISQTRTWAGEPWHLTISRSPVGFWETHAGSSALLALGLLATMFGVALLHAHRERTKYVVQLVQMRTGELRSLNQILLKDIDQRKLAEDELNRSRTQLRSLIDHNARVKEDERKRIARELHDDLGQSLLALKMDLSSMLAGAPIVLTRDQLTIALSQIDGTLAAMRLIINELRPAVLDLGLDAAIEWEAKKYSRRTGIPCDLRLLAPVTPINDEISTALYRIVQESLTNIMRHANATLVSIDLFGKDNWVFLKITDNGVGMRSDSRRKSQSFGLLGMSERIYTLGGAFDVSSVAGEGTTLSIAVPCVPQGSESAVHGP